MGVHLSSTDICLSCANCVFSQQKMLVMPAAILQLVTVEQVLGQQQEDSQQKRPKLENIDLLRQLAKATLRK